MSSVKKAVILHCTDGSPDSNWYSWLKHELEKLGIEVYLPRLPQANRPSIDRYNEFFQANLPWPLDEETTVIGHSSGAVAAIGILELVAEKVHSVVSISVFKGHLGWDQLQDLASHELDLKNLRNKAGRFVFVHSDDDPYCPLLHAEEYAAALNGSLELIHRGKHFSLSSSPAYSVFPGLIRILEKHRIVASEEAKLAAV